MKGRFRKGKKAFNKGLKNKYYNRYLIYLEKRKAKIEAALKAVQTAAIIACTNMKIMAIKMQQAPPAIKALQIAEAIILSAQSTQKLWNQTTLES
jgi:hypothetical protein